MRVLLCEGCGGPLDAPWHDLVVICTHCGNHNLPGRPGDAVPMRVPVDGRPRLNVGGRTYVLESRLAEGDSSVVFRGRWVVRLGERVVIKVLQAKDDADRMRNEWSVLRALSRSHAAGAEHFVGRLPAPVASGRVETDSSRSVSIFGWKPGFVHTLSDVGDAHPDGVKGEVAVWLFKRLLELLGFVHQSGFVHGAVTPDHILVQPYDHGATLIGWTCAVPWSGRPRRLVARSRTWTPLYGGVWEASPALDIAMAARSVAAGTNWSTMKTAPRAVLKAVFDEASSGSVDDAWGLAERLTAASRTAFGPPAHHPLEMPGWSR